MSLDHLHPLVVHFPIALLLTAPIFIVLALFVRSRTRSLASVALLLLALGTLGAWVAVASGETAEHVSRISAQAKPILEQHEDLAEATATVFSILTGVLALIVALPLAIRKLDRPALNRIALGSFLLLLLAGDLLVAKAAHEGGRLVHEFGSSVPARSAS
jgi:uncharacterized membrane protein